MPVGHAAWPLEIYYCNTDSRSGEQTLLYLQVNIFRDSGITYLKARENSSHCFWWVFVGKFLSLAMNKPVQSKSIRLFMYG